MLTAKQVAFCKEIANGKNATAAYQVAFNTKNRTTATVNASKLLKGKAIKDKVKELQSVAKRITAKAQKEAVNKVATEEVMTVAERMKVLSKIARGEIPLIKPMSCDGVIQEIEMVPDWMDRKNAIAELNKMDGSYAPTKQDLTISNTKISVKLNK